MRFKVYHPTSLSAILARNPAFGDPIIARLDTINPLLIVTSTKPSTKRGQACYIAILRYPDKVSKALVAIALMLPPNLQLATCNLQLPTNAI